MIAKNKVPPIPSKPHIYKWDGWWRVTLWSYGQAKYLWDQAHVFKDTLQSRDGEIPNRRRRHETALNNHQ